MASGPNSATSPVSGAQGPSTTFDRYAHACCLLNSAAVIMLPAGPASADVRGMIVDALITVTVLKAPRGRQPGGGYFNPDYVRIEWKAGQP